MTTRPFSIVRKNLHNRDEETPEAKARWFQSLPLEERMEMLCFFTDLILENNPGIVDARDAQQTGRCIISDMFQGDFYATSKRRFLCNIESKPELSKTV